MKEKIRLFFMALLFTLFISGTCMIRIGDETFKAMDKRELWYDADGYFVMISETTRIVGVYDAITPLKKFYCKFDREIENGTVITVADLEDYGIRLSERARRYINEVCPDDTPVLIYQEDKKK